MFNVVIMPTTPLPPVVDRTTYLHERDALLDREKEHTRAGDALAAARRRLPMTEVDAAAPLVGSAGRVSLLDAFEGRTQLFASYHMWHTGHAAADQCEGCTFFSGGVSELAYLHSRGVTYAVFCQGPYPESSRYRDFMGWEMPWYSVPEESWDVLDARGFFGGKVCYLRDGDRVFETYRTTGRGVEPMSASYGILDMTVYGRQETWEDSPEGWPRRTGIDGSQFRSEESPTTNHRAGVSGRPTAQWSRLAAGRDDDLGSDTAPAADHCCH